MRLGACTHAIADGMMQVSAPDARNEDNGFATDNAISALGKIILYQADALGANRAAAVEMFMSHLPVMQDEEEVGREGLPHVATAARLVDATRAVARKFRASDMRGARARCVAAYIRRLAPTCRNMAPGITVQSCFAALCAAPY